MEKLTSKEFVNKVQELVKNVMDYEPYDNLNHIIFLRFALKDLFYYHDNVQSDVTVFELNHDVKDGLCCLLVNVGDPDKYQFWLKEGTRFLKGVDNGNN